MVILSFATFTRFLLSTNDQRPKPHISPPQSSLVSIEEIFRVDVEKCLRQIIQKPLFKSDQVLTGFHARKYESL
ncbi:hypothetical protein RvY_00036 [Ramazzottius varieornatus]|uniref:Uncharacterized protein n=1 Tax=Ramazzottius varieornatus TaxID=947166 RepID=A0A1D1UF12_RAMVA|nr:hypothetical protein RvY_00036 [Ramazzottius varieornatus]